MLRAFVDWVFKRKYLKWQKLAVELWPDQYERAHQFMVEGAMLMEPIIFGQGYEFDQIVISKMEDGPEEGYDVETTVRTLDDIEA